MSRLRGPEPKAAALAEQGGIRFRGKKPSLISSATQLLDRWVKLEDYDYDL
jgi:hypothetical protein